MVSVSPTCSDGFEGTGEIISEESVNGIVCGSVKIASDEGGEIVVRGFFSEDFQRGSELVLPVFPIVAMLAPAVGVQETQVGSGALEVRIHELDALATFHFDGEDLRSILSDGDFEFNFSPDHDGAAFFNIVAVVTLTIEHFIDDFFQAVAVRDFLKENDIRLIRDCELAGVGTAGAVEGGHS